MTARLTRKEKQEKALIDIINKMFEIAGHSVTFDDVKGRQDAWYSEWLMNNDQNTEWKNWGVEYLRKNLKMNKLLAEKEMAWMSLQYGLKISDWK